jgi:lipopolysaccharide/colanic/teichoic acid biosynthesis glycosyltransferase
MYLKHIVISNIGGVNSMGLFLKRLIDIVFSLTLIVILIPLWVVVSILVIIDSKGPVLFKQNRRTQDGKIFKLLKFRTMIVNAEKMNMGLFNFKNDPRVTRFGRFLRKTSIDELPQLVNILKGEMSVVGPRPCVEYELGDFETLNTKYRKRFEVKAGLTGWAQVKGRNDLSWDEKVVYDNEYIDIFHKVGVLVDIYIIFASIIKVFKRESIYEQKNHENMTDEEAATYEKDEIIRLAHQIESND